MSQFLDVTSIYGAPMGRVESSLRVLPQGKLRVYRVRIDSGGYDDGGAYWGLDAPLYCIEDDFNTRRFYRADDRSMAYRKFAREIGGPYPLARFLS